MAVSPAWRCALILILAQAAAERGIHSFSAAYLAENRPVAALVHDAGGLGTQVIKHGIAEFSLVLDQQVPATNPESPQDG